MKVRVTQTAFYGGMRRRVGEVLEVPDSARGTWFVEVARAAPAATPDKVKGRRTLALSEIGKERAVGPLDDIV
jgi:hypothetical protein